MESNSEDEETEQEIEVNEAYLPLLSAPHRYKVLIGGSGSGKSVFIAQKIILRLTTEPNHRILTIRKQRNTLRSSVYQLIIDLLIDYGIYHEFEINKSELRFIHLPTGNEILLSGIDDPEKIKSIQGITTVWVEEATELEENDFRQVELRIRGEKENPVEFLLTLNPIDEDHWIKKRFVDTPDDQVKVLITTYKHNAFLDEEYIKHLTERLRSNENLYRIYTLGEWGRPTTGAEFYKLFRQSKHAGPTKYDPEKPLHISFDFNVNPYMPAGVFQITDKAIVMIDEIALAHPNNTTRQVCNEIKRKYAGHKAGMFIYGDPSGKAQDTRSEKGVNDFKIIQKELDGFNPVLRVETKAPGIMVRGQFINTCFEIGFAGISILIGDHCKKMIADFTYLKEAADGTKLKQKKKDPETGVTYEEYGHFSDLFDYLICSAFKSEFRQYVNGSSKPVYNLGQNKMNKAHKY